MFINVRNSRVTKSCAAFSLMEVMVAFMIFGMVVGGMLCGYMQANRMAEYSSQSLAALSYASQGLEQMRSAQWDAERVGNTNGPGTEDVLPMTLQTNGTLIFTTNQVDTLDVPSTGQQINVTNYITVTQFSTNPPFLRQIMSQVVWTLPMSGQPCTITIVTLRAPDEMQ